MELPTKPRDAIGTNPNIQIIYSLPKAGKTAICALLKDHLMLELEPGGADFVSGTIMDLDRPTKFNEALDTIKLSEKQVCEYLIIDTVTKLDEWSEIVGTYLYMNKAQGKDYNRIASIDGPLRLKHTDPEFETVHEIGHGYGYQYSRTVMTNWYDKLAELIFLKKVKYIILLAHVKDKFLDSKTGELAQSIDLNLTGKVKSIFSSRVDAVGYFFRKGGKGYLAYNSLDKIISGGRCNHLEGEILISEFLDNKVTTYWNKIYLNNKKEKKK